MFLPKPFQFSYSSYSQGEVSYSLPIPFSGRDTSDTKWGKKGKGQMVKNPESKVPNVNWDLKPEDLDRPTKPQWDSLLDYTTLLGSR